MIPELVHNNSDDLIIINKCNKIAELPTALDYLNLK